MGPAILEAINAFRVALIAVGIPGRVARLLPP